MTRKAIILGAGPIGLLNMMVAKAMGATEVVITDINPSRLEVSKTSVAWFQLEIWCVF